MNKLRRLGAAFMCLSMSLSICPWTYTSAIQITDTDIVDSIAEDDANVSVESSVTDENMDGDTPDNSFNNDNLFSGGGKTRRFRWR